jgi:hypothetical protein
MICLAAVLCLILSSAAPSFAAGRVENGSTKAAESELSAMRQYAEEFLAEAYDPFTKARNEYHPDVKALANSTYAECMEIINSATKASDIGGFVDLGGGWIFLDFNETILNGIMTIEDLGTYPRDVYNGQSDIKAIRKKVIKKLDKYAKKAKSKDYNDYNRDMLNLSKKKAYKAAKGITSLTGYMKSGEAVNEYIDCIKYNKNYKNIDLKELRKSVLGDKSFYLYEYFDPEQPAYSKKALKSVICAGQACLDGRVKTEKVPAALKKEIKGFTKKAKKCESVDRICRLWNALDDRITKESSAGAEDEYTNSDYLRLSNKMYTRFYDEYKRSDYTSSGWDELKEILEKYDGKLMFAESMAEAEKLYKKCFAKLKDVPKK